MEFLDDPLSRLISIILLSHDGQLGSFANIKDGRYHEYFVCVQPVVQTCRSKQVPRSWHNYKNAFVCIFKNCYCIERVFFI